jgi:hypothetical protein
LASVWCALRERWLGAAILAALAEGMRLEAWIFVLLLPAVQFGRTRRVPVLSCVILVLPIAAWLLICYSATGDFFSYFALRQRYQASYLNFHPTRRGFAWPDLKRDLVYFSFGANRIVCLGALTTLGWLVVRLWRRRGREWWKPVVVAGFAFSILGMLILAYLTKRQPVILPRYGLFLFLLGLPLLAWLLRSLREDKKPSRLAGLGALIVFGAIFQQSAWQLPIVGKVMGDFRAQEGVTKALVLEMNSWPDQVTRCFTDDVAVPVLSGLPPDRFRSSLGVPAEARRDRAAFLTYLQQERVTHLVFIRTEDSLPVDFLPELGQGERAATGRFQLITMQPSEFGPPVWLYRVRESD